MVKNPIRWVAVICVAITSAYVMWIGNKQLNILSSYDWCSKALQAEKISSQNFGSGLTSCVDLLKIQLNAIARGFLVSAGVIAICLLALIVIVIAGGQVDLSGLGGSLHLGKGPATPAAKAATQTAAAAVDEAKKIVEEQPATGAQAAPGEDG